MHLTKNQTYAKTMKVVFGTVGHSFLLAAAQHNHVEIKVWTHVQSDHGGLASQGFTAMSCSYSEFGRSLALKLCQALNCLQIPVSVYTLLFAVCQKKTVAAQLWGCHLELISWAQFRSQMPSHRTKLRMLSPTCVKTCPSCAMLDRSWAHLPTGPSSAQVRPTRICSYRCHRSNKM